MNYNPEDFDRHIRSHVYDVTMHRGCPPSLAETSASLGAPIEEIKAAFQRLAANRVLVLQRDNGEILMANPFSAVPTPFQVELETFTCFGNCIWDALGIPAMLNRDVRIRTACGDCGTALEVNIRDGLVQGDSGVIHFAIPAKHWWDDIVFN